MTHKLAFGLCAALAVAYLVQAQQPAGRVISVPFERGAYYDAPSGLVPLHASLFLPFQDSGLQSFLGVGSRGVIAEFPGPHAPTAIGNSRPTFYLRGYQPGSALYLVRGIEKDDYREVRGTRDRHFNSWERFRKQDVMDVDVQQMAGNLASVRPRVDLKPGEYVIVSTLEPQYRAIRLAFEFGIARAAGQ